MTLRDGSFRDAEPGQRGRGQRDQAGDGGGDGEGRGQQGPGLDPVQQHADDRGAEQEADAQAGQ